MKELNTTLKDASGGQDFEEKFNDAYCRRLKARYIAQGLIKESEQVVRPGERPYMSDECVQKLRQKMIDNGTLKIRSEYAIQIRGTAPQVCGTSEPRKDEARDVRRVEQRDAQENTGASGKAKVVLQ